MRRFVIVSDITAPDATAKVTAHLKAAGYGWARYFSGAWLLATADVSVTAMDLCKKIMAAVPGVDLMVFETQGGPQWAFWMGNAELTKQFKGWLDSHWS